MRAIFVLTVVGGVGLLTAAVWPGLLEDLVFSVPLFCVSVPLLGCWFLLLVGLALRDVAARPESPTRRRWWGVRSAAVMFGTLALLWLHVPQRAVFAFVAPALRGLVGRHARFGGRSVG